MIYDPNDASNADEAYDDWRQRHADEGTCHVCDGEGEVWVIGPGYDGEPDLIQPPCSRCVDKRIKEERRRELREALTDIAGGLK